MYGNLARGQVRRIETTGWDDVAEAVARMPDSAPGVLERLAQGEARDRLRGEIARLEPDERNCCCCGSTGNSVSGNRRDSGAPETTVKSRFYRILEKLKDELGESDRGKGKVTS
jgi:DNA-directed RNA polymerase specialized sigma24 family protein